MVVEIRDIEGQLIKMRDKMVEDLDLKEPALPVDTQPTIKVAQLRRIVALDAASAVFYPFAEIHHVVWSIAIATGLRPSSFGGKPKAPKQLPRSLRISSGATSSFVAFEHRQLVTLPSD